jgi:hypothetical protein
LASVKKEKKAKLRREKVNEKEMHGNRTFGRAGEKNGNIYPETVY